LLAYKLQYPKPQYAYTSTTQILPGNLSFYQIIPNTPDYDDLLHTHVMDSSHVIYTHVMDAINKCVYRKAHQLNRV
jgi:hypothetical protein